MKRYVLGFVFRDDYERLCLIRKNRPEWQSGKLNGVGGKVEIGEDALFAMAREFQEETGVKTDPTEWTRVVTMHFDHCEVVVFTMVNTEVYTGARTVTDEEIVKVGVEILDDPEVIDNIPGLVLLCFDRLRTR